ncbi:aspartate aminotransferase [Lasiodiplodia theobromae]|nr:aspartate aminotransferase [Lasiodiplodia theobromae]
MSSQFDHVPKAAADPSNDLAQRTKADKHPLKVDLGVGVYKNEQGGYYEIPAISKAKRVLEAAKVGHDYNPTIGIQQFIEGSKHLIFGDSSPVVIENRIASVQTVGGTGANHIAATFLSNHYKFADTEVYLGVPTWVNFQPLFEFSGFKVNSYPYFDKEKRCVDFDNILKAVTSAPSKSIFVLQPCAHNPTGADLTATQWQELADAMKVKDHFPFFDMAYAGLASGDVFTDALPIRLFANQGFELVVAQSFSKNTGLYAERVGACHIVVNSSSAAASVQDQLRSYTRWEVSSTPAYGARLCSYLMSDETLREEWFKNIREMHDNCRHKRKILYEQITKTYNVPGDWEHILHDQGLFSMLDLTPEEVLFINSRHHIYFPASGRINVAALNEENIPRFAKAIHEAIAQ